MPSKKPVKEQWIDNALARRQRIRDDGGHQFTALVDGDHTIRLRAVMKHLRKDEPRLSKAQWLARVIDAAFGAIKQPSIRRPRGERADARSNEPSGR